MGSSHLANPSDLNAFGAGRELSGNAGLGNMGDELVNRVFNTFLKNWFSTTVFFIFLSLRTTGSDSCSCPALRCREPLLITLDAAPDKLLRDKPDENYWALFEVVGFLLSDRLTTAHEDRKKT